MFRGSARLRYDLPTGQGFTKMQSREWQVQRIARSLEKVRRSLRDFGTAIVRKLSCARLRAVLD